MVNSYLNVMQVDLNYILTPSEVKTENFTEIILNLLFTLANIDIWI